MYEKRPTKETYKRNLQKRPTKKSNVCEAHAPQCMRNVSLKKSILYEKGQETLTRDLQKRPTKETYKRDPQRRPTKETYKRDPQKRPTKETYKRDSQQCPTKETLKNVPCAAYLWPAKHPTVNRDLYV